MNYVFERLKPHIGHNVVCVYYGDADNPADICIECEDCCEVLVSAEDYEYAPDVLSVIGNVYDNSGLVYGETYLTDILKGE